MWILEAAWTFAFNFDVVWLSVIFMYGILFVVAMAFIRVQRVVRDEMVKSGGLFQRSDGSSMKEAGGRFRVLWLAAIPTAVNLGWICVASSVNALVCVTRYGGVAPVGNATAYSYPDAVIPVGAAVVGVLTAVVVLVSLHTLCASLCFTIVWALSGVAAASSAASLSTVLLMANIGRIVCGVTGGAILLIPYFPKLARSLSCGWVSEVEEQGEGL